MTYDDKFDRAERSGEDGIFERIDETHPVGIFLGLERQQRALMVICPRRPPPAPSLASIAVDVRARQGGDWALVLRLARPELKGLFSRLVEDLDGATRQAPEDPGQIVIARLARWQRLLSRGAPGVLDDDELRGLAGELDFLLTQAIPAVGVRAGVASWAGPFGAPKDFTFEDVHVEVKAFHPQRDHLLVSSLEQLSDAGCPLHIWTRVVELTTTTAGDQSSVASLVSRARDAVAQDAEAAERLDLALAAAGWEDKPEYGTRGLRFGPSTCYAVREDFPRLQRSNVVLAISSCRYEIVLDMVQSFRIATWQLGGQQNVR